jgi:hypothetical protein
MNRHSTAAFVAMCLAILQPSAFSASSADLFVEIDRTVAQPNDGVRIDVIVGNRGGTPHRDNFDAFLDVTMKGQPVCRAATNFVTPIGPGQSIHALRFDLRPADARTDAVPYLVRASLRYWDRNRGTTQKEATIALPPGRGSCVALKPAQ